MHGQRHGVELIHQLKPGLLAVVVDAGDIDEIIEIEIVFGVLADFNDLLGVTDFDRDFAAKLRRPGNQVCELRLNLFCEIGRSHSIEKLKPRMEPDGHGPLLRVTPCSPSHDISRVARSIDREQSGFLTPFELPRDSNDTALLAGARGFVTNATPVEAVFVAHDLPPTRANAGGKAPQRCDDDPPTRGQRRSQDGEDRPRCGTDS